jgi:hypothetical protein
VGVQVSPSALGKLPSMRGAFLLLSCSCLLPFGIVVSLYGKTAAPVQLL